MFFPRKEFHCGYIYFLALKVSGNRGKKSEFKADLNVKMIEKSLCVEFKLLWPQVIELNDDFRENRFSHEGYNYRTKK